MGDFCLVEPVASLVPGVADGEAVSSGVGLGVTCISVVTCGETGCVTLLLIQIKYPTITTRTKIIITIVTFLLIKPHLPRAIAGYYNFFRDKINILAKNPIPAPSNDPPITSEDQCSPR